MFISVTFFKNDEYNDASIDDVKEIESITGQKLNIIKGVFPNSMENITLNKPISFAHIDVDTYVSAKESLDYLVREGRASTQNTAILDPQNVILKWNHTAPNDVRIDPSISNVVEMTILTETYYQEILKYI